MEEEVKTVVEEKKDQQHFVLVHGVGGGGWCWYKIRCLMETSGYKVTCIDLKSSGIDTADPNAIHSFEQYNQPLIDFLSALPPNDKVILVGHSGGGLSVTDASHKFGDKVSMAVYVAATMLKTGFSSHQDIKDYGMPDLSQFGDAFDAEFGFGLEHPPTSAIVRKELQRKILYQMSPQEDSTLAAMLLRPGPILAILSARFSERNEVDNVPRAYIRTTHDHVIKLERQDEMIKKWPPLYVYTVESDHSPYFSSPFVLFGFLVKAAASVESS